MTKDLVRMAAQAILGLTLLFGSATLIPKGVLFIRLKRTSRGALYICLGLLCAFFCLTAFRFAYAIFTGGRI